MQRFENSEMKRPEGPAVYKAQAEGLGKDETETEGPKVRPFANNSKPSAFGLGWANCRATSLDIALFRSVLVLTRITNPGDPSDRLPSLLDFPRIDGDSI